LDLGNEIMATNFLYIHPFAFLIRELLSTILSISELLRSKTFVDQPFWSWLTTLFSQAALSSGPYGQLDHSIDLRFSLLFFLGLFILFPSKNQEKTPHTPQLRSE